MIGNESYPDFSVPVEMIIGFSLLFCSCGKLHGLPLQPTLQCWHEPNLIMTYWPFYTSLNILNFCLIFCVMFTSKVGLLLFPSFNRNMSDFAGLMKQASEYFFVSRLKKSLL